MIGFGDDRRRGEWADHANRIHHSPASPNAPDFTVYRGFPMHAFTDFLAWA
jgi:hypothetical protein